MTLYYAMIFIIAMSILVVLSLTVFFNINTIVINGQSVYSTDEITQILGIKKGNNLFRIKLDDVENHLLIRLPEIETVKIQRCLPDKLVVTVTPCVAMANLDADGKIFEISQSRKIIKEINQEDKTLLQIKGFEPESTQIGSIAVSTDKYKNEILNTIVDTIKKINFTGITTIDITDRLNIKLIYKDKIPLEVGSSLDLEYKIEFLKSVTDEKIDDDFNGKIVMFGNKFAQILDGDTQNGEIIQKKIEIDS